MIFNFESKAGIIGSFFWPPRESLGIYAVAFDGVGCLRSLGYVSGYFTMLKLSAVTFDANGLVPKVAPSPPIEEPKLKLFTTGFDGKETG